MTTATGICVWASGSIWASSFVAYSDERIKHIDGRSDAARDLSMLLGIEVTDYTFSNGVVGKLVTYNMEERQRVKFGPDFAGSKQLDTTKIDDAVLALLYLGLHDGARAWKGFDWEAMNRLHEKAYITGPRGKAKSVVFTEEGLERAKRLLYRGLSGASMTDKTGWTASCLVWQDDTRHPHNRGQVILAGPRACGATGRRSPCGARRMRCSGRSSLRRALRSRRRARTARASRH